MIKNLWSMIFHSTCEYANFGKLFRLSVSAESTGMNVFNYYGIWFMFTDCKT